MMLGEAWITYCQRRQMAGCRDFSAAELGENAVIIAPHQDDEVLGCGGITILKLRRGATVDIVFLSDGSNSHSDLLPAADLARIRQGEALDAARVLGVSTDRVHFLGLPDGGLEKNVTNAVVILEPLMRRLRPRQVFVPCLWDFPSDHLAARTIGLASIVGIGTATVFEYPVWFWNHWPIAPVPQDRHDLVKFIRHTVSVRAGLRRVAFDRVISIENVLAQKRAALEAHATQMRRHPPDNQEWPTLADIADGRFIAACCQPYECFIETRVESGQES